MYLASGCAPIPEMLRTGVTVGLACDGPASSNNHNIIQAMKFAALQQKGVHQDATIITAEKVMELATIDGARAVGLRLGAAVDHAVEVAVDRDREPVGTYRAGEP